MKTGVRSWHNLIKFINYYFSIGGLLRTLLVPWRQERYVSDQPGIWGWGEQAVFYLFAVFLGFVIRTVTIIVGLITLLFALLLFPIFLII